MRFQEIDSDRHRRRALAVALGALLLAGCTPPAAVRWDSPTLATCQSKVGVLTGKLDRKLGAALAKCKKLYRQNLTPGGSLLIGAVTACESAMKKAFLFPDPSGKSAVAKAKAGLDGLVSNGDCSDTDLLALGHAPAGPLSDRWSRLIVLQRIKTAYEAEAQSTSDMPDIFKHYLGAGCADCAVAATPPCRRTTCTLAPTSSVDAGNSTPLQGSLSFDLCTSNLVGTDFALFGAPTSQALVVDAGESLTGVGTGVQFACLRMLGAQGIVQSAGSTLPGVAVVDVCQDHMVNAPDSDECGFGICSMSLPDTEHPAVTNGGVCTSIAPAGVLAGGAMVTGRFEVTLVGTGLDPVNYPDTRGADGLPCTYDDTATPVGPSYSIVLANGLGVTGTVRDENAVDGNLLSDTIFAPLFFDPAKVAGGDLSGGTLAGFLPAIHAVRLVSPIPPYNDGLLGVRIDCQ